MGGRRSCLSREDKPAVNVVTGENQALVNRALLFNEGKEIRSWLLGGLAALLVFVGAYQCHLAMTTADAKFGVAVFHEPRINPQVHGIPL